MLVITFVNSTISESTSKANYSSTVMPYKYRATAKTKVQTQNSKDWKKVYRLLP